MMIERLQLTDLLGWKLEGNPVTTIRALMDWFELKRGSLLNAIQRSGCVQGKDFLLIHGSRLTRFLKENRQAGHSLSLYTDQVTQLTVVYESGLLKLIGYIRDNLDRRGFRRALPGINAIFRFVEPPHESLIEDSGLLDQWLQEADKKVTTIRSLLRLCDQLDVEKAKKGAAMALEGAAEDFLGHVRSISHGGSKEI